ncbi:hypothetical protein H0A36_13905 [Endozoicomonas sp. SM1973]|uniref:Uncharacterized protein n=1 Tax=Spartinivicinus marinus TaxID=2994442 RepID=A0A853HZH2_9GAMM|nr:hypothetical protein [Spartinivicinus marinus]MCX4028624.1 hypothetical protein [Spartinivicinus marinus]NYZ67110.1 hypothetical protein [Spartinivicinus marinus]
MDITTELMSGASPYLSKLYYDAIKREVVLIAVDNPEDMNDVKKIVFPEIVKYSENVEDLDDELIDGIIGIHWMSKSQICIKTDIREIIITLNGKPYSQPVM